MDFKQIYEYTNTAVKEVLGETAVVTEDLSNIVDIGRSIFNANALDKYVNSLVDHIGKVIFDNRVYKRNAPSVLMDSWEYGQVLEKIRSNLPIAEENETWSLQDGQSYDENVFHQPSVEAKFYDKRTTFEVDISITEKQAKGAFSSPAEMGGFIAMLWVKIDNSIELRNEKLIMATLCSLMGETYHKDIGAATASETSGVKAINLLKEYNDTAGEALTTANCMSNVNFLKYASYRILQVSDYMTNYSTLFNVGGKETFSDRDNQRVVLLSDFARRADTYLQSETFHNEFTRLPNSEKVSFWQGSGTKFDFDSVSKIDIKTPIGDSVSIAHVLGCIFDKYALGVSNFNKRITSKWNAKAEFTNYFYKVDAGYFIDPNENMVMFFIA